MSDMTFNDIKQIFGSSDGKISNVALNLAIKFPDISIKDVVNIFRTSIDKMSSDDDFIVDKTTWWNSRCGGKSLAWINDYRPNIKENMFTTVIFKNLYRIVNDTSEWDKFILKKSFMNGMTKIRNDIVNKLTKDYRNQLLQDKFEVICEFIELVEKKMKST